ncbi:MAG TPA: acyl-CoA dehydrogenase family protein [Trebonia sp.]|jgi:alkylation response protein AidB-like acyl-CoA dehydrogenase|nr:acyl-CoA dehydrogenase family protein [Trebonia sp.]
MDFTSAITTCTDTPDQAELRAVLRDFLDTLATPERVRQAMAGRAGYDEAAWKRLSGELGLVALAVPETRGGAGGTLAEVAVAVAEIGRVLLPVPYLSTALAATVLAEAASAAPAVGTASAAPGAAEAAERYLPGLADGTRAGALVLGDGVALSADGRVSGTVWNVLDGPQADVFLVRASDLLAGDLLAGDHLTGDALVAVGAADATVMPAPTLDQTRPQATVVFDGAPALRVSAADDGGALAGRAGNLLWAALAVESAAAAARCLSMTVEYLKTRVQFGHPIGEFQALKHRCADLAVEAESAHMTAHAAVHAAVSGDDGELAIAAPLAKRYCADAFFRAAAETIQLHGGIGFTWEHAAHLYLKRAKSTQLLHGTPSELRTLIARRAGLLD